MSQSTFILAGVVFFALMALLAVLRPLRLPIGIAACTALAVIGIFVVWVVAMGGVALPHLAH